MGIFDRKQQIQQEQAEEIEKQKKIEKQQRLVELQEQWAQHTSEFYDKGLRAVLKDPAQRPDTKKA